MTAHTISNDTHQSAQASRLLRAQLDTIAQSLPLTVWVNPSWALLSMVPFLIPRYLFGYVPLWHVALIMALHLFNSAVAIVVYRHFQANPGNNRKWLVALTLFQTFVSTIWGATVWLMWDNGDAVNNVFVIMLLTGVLWSYATARTMHIAVYLAFYPHKCRGFHIAVYHTSLA